MASFPERIIGAATLNVATYEEVEHDASAMPQAAAVVALASISSGISWVFYNGLTGILSGTIIALVGWVIGATVVWAIGTRILPGPKTSADIGQVMRTVGFAQSPGLLSFIAIIPLLGWLISFALAIWGIVCWVIAVRQALDYDDTLRAVAVCLLAWLVMFVVMAIGAGLLGLGAVASSMFSQ